MVWKTRLRGARCLSKRGKCKVLHLGRNNMDIWIDEKLMTWKQHLRERHGVVIDHSLTISQQCEQLLEWLIQFRDASEAAFYNYGHLIP